MTKLVWGILGGVLAGVFVGAATYEVLNRYYPDLIKKTEEKAKSLVQSMERSFKEGYAGGKLPEEGHAHLRPVPSEQS